MLTHTKISQAVSKHILPVLIIFIVVAVNIFEYDSDPPEPIPSQPVDEEQFLDIVRRAKEGDDESFATLYRLYYMPILKVYDPLPGMHSVRRYIPIMTAISVISRDPPFYRRP